MDGPGTDRRGKAGVERQGLEWIGTERIGTDWQGVEWNGSAGLASGWKRSDAKTGRQGES